MGGPKRGYKRSWKNLLLNKGYQLKFTLFMVALSALLMALLGWWVLDVASKATSTAINNIRGAPCKNPLAGAEPMSEGEMPTPDRPAREVEVDVGTMQMGSPALEDSMKLPDDPPGPDEDDGDDTEEPDTEADKLDIDEPTTDEPTKSDVAIEGTTTVVTAPMRQGPTAEEIKLARKSYERCIDDQMTKQLDLLDRERLIGWVLLAVGAMLILGLFGYGIKMTHRVAGPLYKVQLYFKKLRDGKYDQVYNLRKGDHLVEFYEVFKHAHDGLRGMAKKDAEELEAIIEAAEKADLASKSPEIAAALEEMRAILKRKEEGLG